MARLEANLDGRMGIFPSHDLARLRQSISPPYVDKLVWRIHIDSEGDSCQLISIRPCLPLDPENKEVMEIGFADMLINDRESIRHKFFSEIEGTGYRAMEVTKDILDK